MNFSRVKKLHKKWMKLADDKTEDKYMRNMYRGDARDLMRVLALVKKKAWRKAETKLSNMDTFPRDSVYVSLPKEVRKKIDGM